MFCSFNKLRLIEFAQMADSIDSILQLAQRKLVVAKADLFLDKKVANTVFILMVEESRGSAGGRAAGSGSRRIDHIFGFSCDNGGCSQVFETGEPSAIEQFDIPYSAVAMDIRLSDGKPFVVQGLVDPELINSYLKLTSNLK